MLNNKSFFTTGKLPNGIGYSFTPKRLLDMLIPIAPLDQSAAKTAASDAIAFASMSNNNHYFYSYQLLFKKVEKYVRLRLHKSYSIPSIIRLTKKLTQ